MASMPASADPARSRAKALRPRVTVGIVTALPKEFAAVKAMLEDPVEDGFAGKTAAEYVLGEIPAKGGGTHAVALVRAGMGNNLATGRATLLLQHYAEIDTLLMVGIAGGVPCPERAEDHVRLGDIVVSDHRGVVQYDFITETRTGDAIAVEHRHCPRPPSARLLEAVGELEVAAIEGQRPWIPFLARACSLAGSARPTAKELARPPSRSSMPIVGLRAIQGGSGGWWPRGSRSARSSASPPSSSPGRFRRSVARTDGRSDANGRGRCAEGAYRCGA
jgi:nucleoside phosphorylase